MRFPFKGVIAGILAGAAIYFIPFHFPFFFLFIFLFLFGRFFFRPFGWGRRGYYPYRNGFGYDDEVIPIDGYGNNRGRQTNDPGQAINIH